MEGATTLTSPSRSEGVAARPPKLVERRRMLQTRAFRRVPGRLLVHAVTG